MSTPVHRLGINALHAAYADRSLSPVAATEAMLARIKATDPALNAFIEIDGEGARAAAAQPGNGPLAGVPMAVKANIAVAGLETACGMEARRGMRAAKDAEAVARLRAAGAVILGTLNMHEAALGADTDNPWFGRAFNPHGDGHTPGGSSGGSGAAVAAGLCVSALGTDTLGSIRIPAAYCGVYGLKPSNGLVSQEGLELVARDFDAIGPLARTLDDLEKVAAVLADLPEGCRPERFLTIAALGGVECEPPVIDSFERALAALAEQGLAQGDTIAIDLMPVRLAGFIAAGRELSERLAPLRAKRPDAFSPALSFLLDYAVRHDANPTLLHDAAALVREQIGDRGVLVTPTTPQVAFRQGSRAPQNQADFTCLANIAGLPALSVPAGLDGNGLPLAIQLIGAAGNERGLIELARAIEPALGGSPPPPIF